MYFSKKEKSTGFYILWDLLHFAQQQHFLFPISIPVMRIQVEKKKSW